MSNTNNTGIFKHCSIHVLPAGMGKKRLSLFHNQILNHGGFLLKKLTPNADITHVVVEDSIVKDPKHCMKLLPDLKFDEVKVVGTEWLSRCLKENRYINTNYFEIHAPRVTIPVHAGISKNCADPKKDLAENSPPKKQRTVELEKYACTQSSSKAECNHIVVKELQKLADAFRSSGDQWRANGYEKAISAIRAYGAEIKNYEQAKALPGVGAKMADKICEILESGSLRKVDEICRNERSQVVELFTKIWGVGPATAQSWYQQGFRTLEDLKERATLTCQQKIGLKYFNEIQDRMSRHEVEEIESTVKSIALTIEPSLKVELCGSYRRGKETCGDVDVLITRPDELQKDILKEIIEQLKKSNFITEDLVSVETNKTHKKYLGLCKLPKPNSKHRRLDIFVVPQSEYVTALMHYTGSALFNRSIRLLATHKGMSLSEHWLMAGVKREGKEVLDEGYVIPTPTEEAIFEQLGLEYKPPEERDH